jgi:sugar lactone lactonase YvrE
MAFPKGMSYCCTIAGLFGLIASACQRALPIALPNRPVVSLDAGPAASDAALETPDATMAKPQPIAIATGQNTPNGLAVDAANLYWTTSDGNVVKAPSTGGQATVLASGQHAPWGIAVDANNVYWVNAVTPGQVMSVSISGGTPIVLADLQQRPFKLAISKGVLYWTNNSGGAVMKLPLAGGSAIKVAERQGSPVAIAIEGSALYWSSIGQGAIRSSSIVGANAMITTIAADQDATTLFVLDGTVYWANVELEDDHGTVYKLPPGGAPVALATSPAPIAAVSDGVNVYWSDAGNNTIRKVPIDGGTDSVVAAEQASPTEIVIDRNAIYWINAVPNGTIMKVAKQD